MRTRFLLAVTLLACGSDPAPPSGGPVYSPALQYAVRGIGSDCTMKKGTGDVARVYTCGGRNGTVEVTVGAGDRLRRIDIKLRSMTLPQAKAHLVPALTPVVGERTIDGLIAQLDKMNTGDSAKLELGAARVAVVAGGKSHIAPEYSLELVW